MHLTPSCIRVIFTYCCNSALGKKRAPRKEEKTVLRRSEKTRPPRSKRPEPVEAEWRQGPRPAAMDARALIKRVLESSRDIEVALDRTERAASKLLTASASRSRRKHLDTTGLHAGHGGGGNEQGGTPDLGAASTPGRQQESFSIISPPAASPVTPSPSRGKMSTRRQLRQLLQKSHKKLKYIIAAQREDIEALRNALAHASGEVPAPRKASPRDKGNRPAVLKKAIHVRPPDGSLLFQKPDMKATQASDANTIENKFKTPTRLENGRGAKTSRRQRVIALLKNHRRLSLRVSALRDETDSEEAIAKLLTQIADVVKALRSLNIEIPEHLNPTVSANGKTKANPQSSGKPTDLELPTDELAARSAETKASSTPKKMKESLPSPGSRRFEYLFARIMAGPSPNPDSTLRCSETAAQAPLATSLKMNANPAEGSGTIVSSPTVSKGFSTPKRRRRRPGGKTVSLKTDASPKGSSPVSPRNPTPGSRKRARKQRQHENMNSVNPNDDIAEAAVLSATLAENTMGSPSPNNHGSLLEHFERLGLESSAHRSASDIFNDSPDQKSSSPTIDADRIEPGSSPAAPRRLFVCTPPRLRDALASCGLSSSEKAKRAVDQNVTNSGEGFGLPFPAMSPILEPVDRSAVFDEHDDLEDLHVVKTLDMFSASKRRRKSGIPSPSLYRRHRTIQQGVRRNATASPKLGNRVNLRNSLRLARK